MTSSGPHGSDPYASWGESAPSRPGADPYGADPYGSGPTSDPYGAGRDPYGPGSAVDASGADLYGTDPYGPDPGGTDPYAAGPQDPLAAPGYTPGGFAPVHSGPQFGDRVGYGTAYVPPPPTSSMAITGFVLGLLAISICSGLTSPFGVVFSLRGMAQTAPDANPPASGRGLAIAGLVTSIIGLVPLLLVLGYLVVLVLVYLADPSAF